MSCGMKIRTLVTQRQYYGMEAVALRAAMARVLSRVAGLPADAARVSRRHLYLDFGLDTTAAQQTLDQMVADGLLQQPDERQPDFALTERFLEFATARVVEPLPRDRARQLLGKVCLLATQINPSVSWSAAANYRTSARRRARSCRIRVIRRWRAAVQAGA